MRQNIKQIEWEKAILAKAEFKNQLYLFDFYVCIFYTKCINDQGHSWNDK